MATAGAPVVKAGTILTGIRSALEAGYSPRMVLIGLGMWEGEGFRSPRQVEEWVQKAARQGAEPQNPASAADLLAESRRRYYSYFDRKTAAGTSKGNVRRQRSMAAIRAFNQGVP